jgi:hypothetical protein
MIKIIIEDEVSYKSTGYSAYDIKELVITGAIPRHYLDKTHHSTIVSSDLAIALREFPKRTAGIAFVQRVREFLHKKVEYETLYAKLEGINEMLKSSQTNASKEWCLENRRKIEEQVIDLLFAQVCYIYLELKKLLAYSRTP